MNAAPDCPRPPQIRKSFQTDRAASPAGVTRVTTFPGPPARTARNRRSQMLTQTADYALRALIYLAHDPDDGYHQTRDLAGLLNIPHNYLGKILQQLGHSGIVESQRGMNG